MNNRDPFGIRATSPRSLQGFIQTAEFFGLRVVNGIQDQMRQTSRTISGSTERPALPGTGYGGGTMENTSRHASAPYESQQQRKPGRRSTLMGEKLNDISNMITGNTPPALPLYKDKPYSYPTSSKPSHVSSRGRLLLPILAAAVFIFYIAGGTSKLPRPTTTKDPEDAYKKSHVTNTYNGILSDPSVPTGNWEDRRERVKDAFKVSWKAYEDNAWGKLLVSASLSLAKLLQVTTNIILSPKQADRWCRMAWDGSSSMPLIQ